MDLLRIIEEVGLLAALSAHAVPDSREAKIAALSSAAIAAMARALREARDHGVDLAALKVPSLDEMVEGRLGR